MYCRFVQLTEGGMNSDIFAHTAYSVFSAHKTLHLLKGLGETFFFYLAPRQEDDTSIYLTWQRDKSCFHLSFDSLGTASGGHFLFLSFFPSFGRERRQRESEERAGGIYGDTVKSPDKQETGDSRKKSALQDEKRHKGFHCLTSGVPFITTSISFFPLSGDVTSSKNDVPTQPNCKQNSK